MWRYIPQLSTCVLMGCIMLILNPSAQAAGPYLTDDAGITTAETAQLESWFRFNSEQFESWILPAVQIFPNFELTLGVGTIGDWKDLVEDVVFQGKTLFKPLETNGWGIGWVLGTTLRAHGRPAGGPAGNLYTYIPVSLSFFDDMLISHVNFGYLYDAAAAIQHTLTWNIACEYRLHQQLSLVLETYGDFRSLPFYQGGVRFWIQPDLTAIDLTLLGQFNASPQLSVGVSFYEIVQRQTP